MKFPEAIRRPLDWLFGTGSGVLYQGKCRTESWTELCYQVEEAVRVSCPEAEGYVVRSSLHNVASFVRAYRGLTSGLSVGLIPQERQASGALVLITINRWSRLHSFGIQLATACFFLAVVAGIVAAALAGWQVPFMGWILLVASALVAILFLKVLFLGINRVTWRDMTPEVQEHADTLVHVVRAVVETANDSCVPCREDSGDVAQLRSGAFHVR